MDNFRFLYPKKINERNTNKEKEKKTFKKWKRIGCKDIRIPKLTLAHCVKEKGIITTSHRFKCVPKFLGHQVFIYSPKKPWVEFLWFRSDISLLFQILLLGMIDFLIPIVTWSVLNFSVKYPALLVKFVSVWCNALQVF